MPRIEVEGHGSFEAPEGTRLVHAIEGHGVDILHLCGGYAKCTTCRVQFLSGEPSEMTVAEHTKLTERGLIGEYRLSCQIPCKHDMHVRVGMTLGSSGRDDPGDTPEDSITPEPEWMAAPATNLSQAQQD